jgi:hypothetical protein
MTTSLAPASDPADARVPEVAPHAGPKALLRASGPSGETGVATFRWRKPVRAAAFERADILWVVFGAALGELAGTDESDLNLAGLRELERVERKA